MITKKLVLNTSWGSPTLMEEMVVLVLYMFVTIVIEVGIIYWLAKRKNYRDIDDLLLTVLLANTITGAIGIILTTILF